MTAPSGEGGARQRLPDRLHILQPTALLWLTTVWVILWQDLSVANFLVGFVVAVLVCIAFPLPAVRMSLRIHPLWLVWLVIYFLYDLTVATAQVILAVLTPRRARKNAVFAVQMQSRSDFVLTVVGQMVTLTPGTLVVEVRRHNHTLFIHALGVSSEQEAERERASVLAQEQRVLRALGPGAEEFDEGVEVDERENQGDMGRGSA